MSVHNKHKFTNGFMDSSEQRTTDHCIGVGQQHANDACKVQIC